MSSSTPSNFASVGDDVESSVAKTQPQPRNEPGTDGQMAHNNYFCLSSCHLAPFFAPHRTQAVVAKSNSISLPADS